jgi:hypothetical protein
MKHVIYGEEIFHGSKRGVLNLKLPHTRRNNHSQGAAFVGSKFVDNKKITLKRPSKQANAAKDAQMIETLKVYKATNELDKNGNIAIDTATAYKHVCSPKEQVARITKCQSLFTYYNMVKRTCKQESGYRNEDQHSKMCPCVPPYICKYLALFSPGSSVPALFIIHD